MKYILSLLMIATTMSLFGQISLDSTLSISGSVDVYYRTNLSSANLTEDGSVIAPGTSFANLPGFSLGMFNLVTSYDSDKVGFVADMVFGPRGADAVFASPAPLNIVNQLYGYWNISDKVTFTLGNFNTFLGYEVISPTANFNYSTSYMFSYGPFSHSGAKLDFDLGGGLSAMVGVFNPTDYTDYNPFTEYAAGAQLGYSNDMGGAWLNVLVSKGFYQLDLTTGWQVTDAMYLGLNATTAQESFAGAAVYLQYGITDNFALGVRGEYFSDSGIEVVGTDENVTDLTLSANYKIGALTLIPEVRIDMYSNADNLSSFLLAAVYAF